MTQSSQEMVNAAFSQGDNLDSAMKHHASGLPGETPRAPKMVAGRSGGVVREYDDRDPVIVQLPPKRPNWLEISRQHLAETLPSTTPQDRL